VLSLHEWTRLSAWSPVQMWNTFVQQHSNSILVLPTNLHCTACAGDSNKNQQVATRMMLSLIAEDLYW